MEWIMKDKKPFLGDKDHRVTSNFWFHEYKY